MSEEKGMFKKFTGFFVTVEDDDSAKPVAKKQAPPRPPKPKKSLYDPAADVPDEMPAQAPQDLDPPQNTLEFDPFEDIYIAAGLPTDGFTVYKMADIMHSPHLTGLEGPAVVASVKVALEASNVSVQSIIDDATYRAVALDAYEKELGPRLQEFAAQITTECEALKAEADKLREELEVRIQQKNQEIASKVTELEAKQVEFRDWQTRKQKALQQLHATIDPFVEGANPVRIDD